MREGGREGGRERGMYALLERYPILSMSRYHLTE